MYTPSGAARDLARTREIAAVLFRSGFGDLAHRLGLAGPLQRVGKLLHLERAARARDVQTPERLRVALEALGPTFVKLGQVLASRSDLLAPEWIAELGRLREHARPVAWPELRAQLAEDLRAAPESVFEALDSTPLASASIAQVHRARLGGREVVLKIRRPGIRATVEADLRLLARLAEFADARLPDVRHWNPREIVRQFARTLSEELDFRGESRNASRIAAAFAGEPRLTVPHVHESFTRERLLVMDFVDAPSVAQWLAKARAAPQGSGARDAGLSETPDPSRVAALGAELVLEMVFVQGFYHADPHPGNVLLLGGERIALIDFGMVGHLSAARRTELSRLLRAVTRRDEAEIVAVLSSWAHAAEPVDTAELASDCSLFLDRWHGVPLGELDIRALLADIAALVRAHHIALPADVSMLLKVFVTLEGLGRELDPGFDMARHASPFVRRALRHQLGPLATARRAVADGIAAAAELPRGVRQLLEAARDGRFRVELDLKRLDRFGQEIDRSANRLTLGMVTAALIIGTAISLTVAGGPRVFGLPLFGVLGFASSIVLGLGLIASIRRSRHEL